MPSRAAASREVLPRSLVVVPASTERVISEPERLFEDRAARMKALDAELETLSAALAEFTERCEERLGDAIDERVRARSVVSRLEQIEAELMAARGRSNPDPRKATSPPRSKSPSQAARHGRPPARDHAEEPAAGRSEPAEVLELPSAKELYRRLARKLHPDLATSEADRSRRSRLMARLNAAYAGEDVVKLELLSLEIDGQGGAEAEEDARARLLERRGRSMAVAIERLERDLRRLRSGSDFVRFDEHRRRSAQGADYFSEELSALAEQARSLRATFADRILRVERAARALNTSGGEPITAFRASVVTPPRNESQRVAASRAADALVQVARDAPWKAAWVAAAFFAEVSDRPPLGLRTLAEWEERYEGLRPALRRGPPFAEALASLPPLLELGCRVHAHGVRFGVQLREAAALSGVHAALAAPPCRRIAADVLRVLGPRMTCACGASTYPIHLHRVRDLDPLHALVCARCGASFGDYRAVGTPEGLEALSPYAVELGVLEEVTVSFGGASVALEMLPRERQRLTAAQLSTLFSEALLRGLPGDVHERKLRVRSDGKTLARSARVPRDAAVTLSFIDRGKPAAARVVSLLGMRRRRRFRQS